MCVNGGLGWWAWADGDMRRRVHDDDIEMSQATVEDTQPVVDPMN